MSVVAPASPVSTAAVAAPVTAPAPAVAAPAPAAPPPDAEPPVAAVIEPTRQRAELQEELDRTLADSRTSLQFRVDEAVERVVVTVLDARGEKIIQIPNEAALKIARALADTGRGLLDEEA